MNDELTTEGEIEAFATELNTTKETIICIIKIIKSNNKQKIEAYFRKNNITRKAKRKNSDYEFSR